MGRGRGPSAAVAAARERPAGRQDWQAGLAGRTYMPRRGAALQKELREVGRVVVQRE